MEPSSQRMDVPEQRNPTATGWLLSTTLLWRTTSSRNMEYLASPALLSAKRMEPSSQRMDVPELPACHQPRRSPPGRNRGLCLKPDEMLYCNSLNSLYYTARSYNSCICLIYLNL